MTFLHTSGPTAPTPSSNHRPQRSCPKVPSPHEWWEARSIDPPFAEFQEWLMQGAIENKGKRWWLLRKASRIGDVACLYWHTVSGSCRVYCSMSLMHLITGASHPDRPLPPVHVTRARTARDAMKLISCRRVSVLYYVVAQHLRYQDPIP